MAILILLMLPHSLSRITLSAGDGISITGTSNKIGINLASNSGLTFDSDSNDGLKVILGTTSNVAAAGNHTHSTYATTFSISDHTITLKNGSTTLSSITVPDNNTTYSFQAKSGSNGVIQYKPSTSTTWTDITAYTHPTTTSATAAAVKVGKDTLGHVVIGSALTYSDVGAASAAHTHTYSDVGAASSGHTHSTYATTFSISDHTSM